MALDDVRHVEAVAIIRELLDDGGHEARAAALGWIEENHPPPSAYVAAMKHLSEGRGE